MSEMRVEFGYRHADGRVTPMGVQYLPFEIERNGTPTMLTELHGEPVTQVKRYVTYGEWERVHPETQPSATDYEMYTDEGNAYVAAVIDALIASGVAGGFTRNELDAQLKAAIAGIAKVHPEVYDTEPEWAICDEINSRLCDPAGWRRVTREDW